MKADLDAMLGLTGLDTVFWLIALFLFFVMFCVWIYEMFTLDEGKEAFNFPLAFLIVGVPGIIGYLLD